MRKLKLFECEQELEEVGTVYMFFMWHTHTQGASHSSPEIDVEGKKAKYQVEK